MKKVFFTIMILIFLWSIDIYSGDTNDESNSNNFNDINIALNYFLVSDSYLETVEEILQRQRVLAIKAANNTYNHKDIEAFEAEFTELLKEITWIKNNSRFGDFLIFSGHSFDKDEYIYINSGERKIKYVKPKLGLEFFQRYMSNPDISDIFKESHLGNMWIGIIDDILEYNCKERNRLRSITKRLQIISNQQMKINSIEKKLF